MYFWFKRENDLLISSWFTSSEESSPPERKEKKHEKQKQVDKDSFSSLQESFFEQMHAFLDILPHSTAIVPHFEGALLEILEKKTIAKISTGEPKDDNWTRYKIPPSEARRIVKEYRKSTRAGKALDVFPSLALLGLVSQFDAFMGRLLRLCLEHKPHIIQRSQKSFPANEVFQYTDVESFKAAVVDKEVEDFLRKSHADQFDWLQENFGVKTRDGLESWPDFIEACERRNLFAHSNGVVSQQYLIKCGTAGHTPKVRKGDSLHVTPKYLKHVTEVFLELGIKIAQVLSRSIMKSDDYESEADERLNQTAYSLIEHQHYDLARKLLDFGCSILKKHPNTTVLNMMIINRANCFKLMGDKQEAEKILGEVDWSPYDPMFRISVAAILEDVDEVLQHMPRLTGHAFINADAYRSWPVFETVRQDERVQAQFFEIYGQDLLSAVPSSEEADEENGANAEHVKDGEEDHEAAGDTEGRSTEGQGDTVH